MTGGTDLRRQEITRVVHEIIGDILPGLSKADIQGGKNLKELGADSVDRIEIIVAITSRLGLNEPLSRFSGIKDIDALVSFLCDRVLA